MPGLVQKRRVEHRPDIPDDRYAQVQARQVVTGILLQEQQRKHHRRVPGFRADAAVGLDEGVDIQLIDDNNHETREMLLRQIILHRGRKQIGRVTADGFEGLLFQGRPVVTQASLLKKKGR